MKDKEEKLTNEKASVSELKIKLAEAYSKRVAMKVQVGKLKIEVKAIWLAINQAVDEYKKSKDFKVEVAEGCLESLHLRFLECKKKVAKIFPSLCLSTIIESDDEGNKGNKEEEE